MILRVCEVCRFFLKKGARVFGGEVLGLLPLQPRSERGWFGGVPFGVFFGLARQGARRPVAPVRPRSYWQMCAISVFSVAACFEEFIDKAGRETTVERAGEMPA